MVLVKEFHVTFKKNEIRSSAKWNKLKDGDKTRSV